MQIDWFTFIAQIINFLILVFLLRLFLYRPIIRAMSRREERIASRLEEADSKRNEADETRKIYEKKQQELENKKDEMLELAKKDAEEKRKELVARAKNEVENLRKQWVESVSREKESFAHEIRTRLAQEIHKTVQRIFRDLADYELEQQMIKVFMRQVNSLPDDKWTQLREHIHDSKDGIVVLCSSDISSDDKKKIRDTLNEHIGDDYSIEFKSSSEVILGIELRLRGHKIAWSVQQYLDTVENNLMQIINQLERKQDQKEKQEEHQNKVEKD